MGGLGDWDLWFASRASAAQPFGAPVHLALPSTPGFDCCPEVSADGARLLYTSNQLGMGFAIAEIGLDAAGLPIGTPAVVAEIDGPEDDFDAFLTRDGAVLGFTSNRPGGVGEYDLYLMERACP